MTRHILKIEVVQIFKWRIATVTIINNHKGLKEIDRSQNCIATAKKHGAAKKQFHAC